MDKYVRWHKRQHSRQQRVVFLVIQGIFFLILLPLLILWGSQKLDIFLSFREIMQFPFNLFLGILLFAVGMFLAQWAIMAQFRIGQGTPAPIMPTQKLVVEPPYTYCRNPMGLGTGILFIGFGIIFNSWSFVLISILLFVIYLLYYKFVEEKELAARFGEEYLEYKKRTPFLIPTFRKRP